MTYRELIAKYENDLNTLNKGFLEKFNASKEFIKLDKTKLEQQEKTIQFHLYSLTKELNKEINDKIEEIKSKHAGELDNRIE